MPTDPMTIALTSGGLALTAALLGQLVAGCITNGNNKKTEMRAFEQKRKAMTLQIYAEIHAALVIVRERKYLEGLDGMIRYIEQNPDKPAHFEVHVADESFPIFKANVSSLGLMPCSLVTQVVTFYTLIQSLVQDVKPGGMLAMGAPKHTFEEALHLGRQMVAVGELIVREVEELYPEVKKHLPVAP